MLEPPEQRPQHPEDVDVRRPQRQRARVRGEVAALERVCVREVLFRGGVVPTQQMRLPVFSVRVCAYPETAAFS